MKIKKLLKEIPNATFKGSKDVEITGICANSKIIVPGNLFIAKKGRIDDGSKYIPEAVSGGAAAILTDVYDPSYKHIAQIIHPDVAAIEASVAAAYYQHPSDELFLVGITGTNGKTTTSFLVKYILDALNSPCGLIGTIEYIIGQHRYQATRTTPDVTSNHKMLREMVRQGCRSAVMEVTSHALDQGRVQNIDFNVGVYTHLSLDHLDYHHTMDNYCAAKNRLFASLDPKHKKHILPNPHVAVINADCPWHEKVTAGCQAEQLTYGVFKEADLRATDIELLDAKTHFNVHYQGTSRALIWPLIGRFNVYNCLAAIGVGLAYGASLDRIIDILRTPPTVRGRLQPVPNALDLKIFVDFAHTDDALVNVLECLRELKQGKIITIFGCGGDRDRSKRAKMAQAVEEHADFAIVTSDNPRSEDPAEIAREIVQGFKSSQNYCIELDRREAIKKGIEMASAEDILLIAGKGHETYQIFAHKTIEFDDAKVAAHICDQLKATVEV